MSDPQAAAEPSRELPPLRIHHFLVWMAVAAVLFSFWKRLGGIFQFRDTSDLVEVLYQALSLSIFVYGLIWTRRGMPFFAQPGSGILLVQFLIFVLSATGIVMNTVCVERTSSGAFMRYRNDSEIIRWYVENGWYVWTAIELITFIGCGLWIARSARWRAFFFLNAAVAAAQFATSVVIMWRLPTLSQDFVTLWLTWLEPVFNSAPAAISVVTLGLAMFLDRRDNIHHHWSHWCAVIGFFATSCMSIANELSDFLTSPNLYSVPPQIRTTTF